MSLSYIYLLIEQGDSRTKRKAAVKKIARQKMAHDEENRRTNKATQNYLLPESLLQKKEELIQVQETEPLPRVRRDKRKRAEVLVHTVARPSQSQVTGRAQETSNAKKTRKGDLNNNKPNQRESAAHGLFGDASAYDPYVFE